MDEVTEGAGAASTSMKDAMETVDAEETDAGSEAVSASASATGFAPWSATTLAAKEAANVARGEGPASRGAGSRRARVAVAARGTRDARDARVGRMRAFAEARSARAAVITTTTEGHCARRCQLAFRISASRRAECRGEARETPPGVSR